VVEYSAVLAWATALLAGPAPRTPAHTRLRAHAYAHRRARTPAHTHTHTRLRVHTCRHTCRVASLLRPRVVAALLRPLQRCCVRCSAVASVAALLRPVAALLQRCCDRCSGYSRAAEGARGRRRRRARARPHTAVVLAADSAQRYSGTPTVPCGARIVPRRVCSTRMVPCCAPVVL
jgi:hypothetical protein